MVDGVVVDERCEVHQLDDRCERHDARLRRALGLAREKRERRAKHLAAHLQQVAAYLLDHREVGRDDAPHLDDHLIETLAHRCLDVAQRGRGGGADARRDAAHERALSRAASRSPTSLNWMSITNTR
jgi:hypothetical protein